MSKKKRNGIYKNNFPYALWMHSVDGTNRGVPIASTMTLYYLEDVHDWPTILRGRHSRGPIYIPHYT